MFDLELEPQLSDRELEALTASELAAWDHSDVDRHQIPSDLGEWPPGPLLATVLSTVDPSKVNGYDLVILMKAHARQVAHDQAAYYRLIGEVATAVPSEQMSGSNTPTRK